MALMLRKTAPIQKLMQRRKTREEIANEFFINKSEIQRLFGLSRSGTDEVFHLAMDDTAKTLFEGSKVRLTTVCNVLQISEAELKRKVSHGKEKK